MCHYTLQVSRCGHLSRTYKNAFPCNHLSTQCRANPNGETLPHLYLSTPVASPPRTAYLSLGMTASASSSSTTTDDSSTSSSSTSRSINFLPLAYADPSGKAIVTFAPNLRTSCAWCDPGAYARMMEREEGVEFRKGGAEEAVARREMAELVGGDVMGGLEGMIDEGLRRGWGDEGVEEEMEVEEVVGAKEKRWGSSSSGSSSEGEKKKAKTVRFLDEDLPSVLVNGAPIHEVKGEWVTRR